MDTDLEILEFLGVRDKNSFMLELLDAKSKWQNLRKDGGGPTN